MTPSVLNGRRLAGSDRRPADETILIALEVFTGLTAMIGGDLLMARPDGALMRGDGARPARRTRDGAQGSRWRVVSDHSLWR